MKKSTYSFDMNASKLHKRLVFFFRERYPGWELYQNFPIKIDGTTLYADLYFKVPHPLIVECQGIQHYEYTKFYHKNFSDFEHANGLDNLKKLWAEMNGFTFVEVDGREKFDPDVFNNVLMKAIMDNLNRKIEEE